MSELIVIQKYRKPHGKQILYLLPTTTMTPVHDANGQEIQRTKCEIYTRVMWYCRPVTNFNEGKKSEFYSRKYYKVAHPNQKFNAEFCGGCSTPKSDDNSGDEE